MATTSKRSARWCRQASRRQELAGGTGQAQALARVDRLLRRAEGVAAAQAHLDEAQHRAVERDQVDLAAAQPYVSRQDAVAGALEVSGGEPLAAASANRAWVRAHAIGSEHG